jgi:pantoate--beta-alanine ligase
MSLVDTARRLSDYTCVTIFVNPTQFAPHEDLSRYPRPLERDLELCDRAGVDLVFTPEVPALYPTGFQTWVTVEEVTQPLEGAFRSTHFRGVTTVVAKLFNIVQPALACFGMKDYQQLAVIRRMVRDLDFPIEIVACETVREADGLALSSRNVYLSAAERVQALALSRSLQLAERLIQGGQADLRQVQAAMLAELTAAGVAVDYAVIADRDRLQELQTIAPEMVALVAGRVGSTRLIDNREIQLPH